MITECTVSPFSRVAMTTQASRREIDTHECTPASRSGHTTIWLESLSKFGPFTAPDEKRVPPEGSLSLSDSLSVYLYMMYLMYL